MATKKIKRFESGGVSDKDRGLEASKDDKVGFFERMRMGNIDEEGSEAYNRFGAGRAKADRDAASEAAAMRAVDASRAAPAAPAASPAAAENKTQENASENILAAGRKAGERKGTGDASVAEMYQGPRTNSIVADVPKPVNKPRVNVNTEKTPTRSVSAKSSAYPMTKAQPTTKTYDRTGGPTANELANYRNTRSLASQIPDTGNPSSPTKGEKVEPMSDTERNISNILAATGAGAGAVSMLYKGKKMLDARKAVQAGAKKRAELKRATEEGIDRNLADEFKDLASSTAKTPAKKTTATSKNSSYGSAREDAKADKAYKNLRDSDFTRSPRNDKTLNPMAWMSGPKGMADDFKRGGKVKPAVKKMASGGMVSNASKRADGIATKGKTRCKMR